MPATRPPHDRKPEGARPDAARQNAPQGALPEAQRMAHGMAEGLAQGPAQEVIQGVAQRAGNQETLRSLGVRAKPAVSQPGDADERMADEAAEAFIAGRPAPPAGTRPDAAVQRQEGGPAPVQPTAPEGPAALVQPGAGAPLATPVRREFEQFFNADLGDVRIHTGGAAQRSAAALAARAYTRGTDIAFAAGQFDPITPPGRRLLAHELAHAVQGRGDGVIQRQPVAGADPAGLAAEDERKLAMMTALPGANFIRMAADLGGLKGWQAGYPRSYEEMRKRAIAAYGAPAYNALLASDARALALVKKSTLLQERLLQLRAQYDERQQGAIAVIDFYHGSTFLWGDSVQGWYEISYDWLARQFAALAGFDLKLYEDLLGQDVDSLIRSVREQADLAQQDADADQAQKEAWAAEGAAKLGTVVAKREDFLFDDEMSLTAVLAPPEGSAKADEMLAIARYAGVMAAVLKVGERYFAYRLSEQFSRENIVLAKDWDSRTQIVRWGPGGNAVHAIVTTNGYVIQAGAAETRMQGGAQARDPESHLDADTELLTSGKAAQLGIPATAIFQSMVRNLALLNLKQAERNLQGVVGQMAPEYRADPGAGKALQAATARLRQLTLDAARLAVEIGDRKATDEEVDRSDAVLSEMGALVRDNPAAGFFVKNSRDPDDKDPVKEGQVEDDLAGMQSGDAAVKAIDEAKRRRDNIGKVRRAMFDTPDIVLGFDVLHEQVLQHFSTGDRLLVKASLGLKTIGDVAATLGLLAVDLTLLVAGFFTGGATWAGLALHGAGLGLGLYQTREQFQRADMLSALSAMDVEGGFALATPAQAKSAHNWALVGAALNFLSFLGFASTASKLLAATQREANLVARIAARAGVSEEILAAALRRNWRGLANPDPAALRAMVLAKLPAPLARRYSGLVVKVLSEEEWAARYGASSASHAATDFTKNAAGQLVPSQVLFRRSGNIFALHEEAMHIAQAADPQMVAKIEAIAGVTQAAWLAKAVPDKLRTIRTVLEVELDAQERLLARAQAAGDVEGLDDAFAEMEQLSRKLVELDNAIANPAGKVPAWFEAAEIPTLFATPRLPRSNGKWTGAIGNSLWKSNKPEVLSIVGTKGVRFRNGYPDFSEYSVGQVTIGQTGHASDFAEADLKFAEGIVKGHRSVPPGFSRADFMHNGEAVAAGTERFRRAAGLTWHHHQGGNLMLLVPTKLHANIPHTGGASASRAAGP